jgi:phospholipid/cholesterol/gamma-HCH transport system substrate-binding protein
MSRLLNRQRVLGLTFVVLLLAALTMSVLQYNKVFTPADRVTLKTDRTGMQLSTGAEVKLHGVVVGDVRSISADGSGATLKLALDPELSGQIPADVTARLLPKTLFGERYVALVPTAKATSVHLSDGAVITQDRSTSGVEVQKVLDDILPLLQAIQPDKLAATLGALSTALQGKGERLGQDLSTLDRYLTALNKEMPAITDDVRKLAIVLNGYDQALPDLLAFLRDVSVTMDTVVDQREQLQLFLADSTEAADATTLFLNKHGDQLIQFGSISRPLLETLAAYSPEYPCLLEGLQKLKPLAEQVFEGGEMHVTLEVTAGQGKYLAGQDEPVYAANSGPNCHGLPNNVKVPAPAAQTPNGYDYGANRPKSLLPVGLSAPVDMGDAGTGEEQNLLKPLIGAATGALPVEVPDIAVLLWGPLLRGAVVNAK